MIDELPKRVLPPDTDEDWTEIAICPGWLSFFAVRKIEGKYHLKADMVADPNHRIASMEIPKHIFEAFLENEKWAP